MLFVETDTKSLLLFIWKAGIRSPLPACEAIPVLYTSEAIVVHTESDPAG